MNIKAFKTTGLSFALAAAFLVIAGGAGSSNTFAQDERGRDRERDGGQDNRRDRDGWQDNRPERDDWQDNRRERFEERRGFRDGLIRGREDALEGRRFNPFGSYRFRFGSSDYRQGFRMGYAQAYRRANYRDGYRNDQYRQRGYDDRGENSRRY